MLNKLRQILKSDSTVSASADPVVRPEVVKPVLMQTTELLEIMNLALPRALLGVTDKQAEAVISAVLRALGTRMDAAGDTPFRVAGLGVFRPREAARNLSGEALSGRNFVFRRIPAAAKAAEPKAPL